MLILFLSSISQMALIPILFQTPSIWWTHAEIPLFWAFIVLTTSAHMCISQIFVKISESRVSEWSEYVELSIQKRQNETVCICAHWLRHENDITHSLFHTDESLFNQGSIFSTAIKSKSPFSSLNRARSVSGCHNASILQCVLVVLTYTWCIQNMCVLNLRLKQLMRGCCLTYLPWKFIRMLHLFLSSISQMALVVLEKTRMWIQKFWTMKTIDTNRQISIWKGHLSLVPLAHGS